MAGIIKGLVSDGTLPSTAKSNLAADIAAPTSTVRQALDAAGLGKGASDADIAAFVNNTSSATGTALASKFVTPTAVSNAVSAEAARADATFFRPVPNTIAFLGDSFTAMSHETNGLFTYRNGRGFITWGLQRLGQRLRVVARAGTLNGGVTGQTAAQIAARVQADVLDLSPGYAHVLAGTNDVLGEIPLATTAAALTDIYDRVLGAGIRLIVGTIAPLNSTYTNAQRGAIEDLNGWIREQAMTRPGITLADYHVVLAGVDGTWRDNTVAYTADGIHASTGGAMRMGKVLADALENIVPANNVLPTSNRDSSLSASTMKYPNLLANPLMAGTAGTLGTTGATGTVADSWIVSTYLGGGNTTGMTFSKTPRTDGPAGDWQVIDSTNTAAKLRLQQTVNTSANLAAGDRVVAAVEYEWESLTDLQLFRVQLAAFDANNGYANQGTVIDTNIADADVAAVPESMAPMRGVLMTPELVYPGAATGVTFSVDLSAVGKLRIGRAMFRRYRGA